MSVGHGELGGTGQVVDDEMNEIFVIDAICHFA